MKRFIASITPDTCEFLEKRTKQSQIKSAMTCKWGGKKSQGYGANNQNVIKIRQRSTIYCTARWSACD